MTNNKRLEFIYDHQGRRVQKLVYNRSAGAAWVLQTTKRFVYDGWNMIEEQTVSAATKYYVYGLDLSQSLQGAGGVGGLLAKAEGAATHNYFYDANGNVSQMVNASGGAITARYEYDAYGNSILATGAQATSNPFRFSSKYFDAEYSLYYYGYRFYDPATGRWLSRDPLGEEGGFNLYGFVNNNSINSFDLLGLKSVMVKFDIRIKEPDIEPGVKASAIVEIDDASLAVLRKEGAIGTTSVFGRKITGGGQIDVVAECDEASKICSVGFRGSVFSRPLSLAEKIITGIGGYPSSTLVIDFALKTDLNLCERKGAYGVAHDGYPSYKIEVDGASVYEFQQTAILKLDPPIDVYSNGEFNF